MPSFSAPARRRLTFFLLGCLLALGLFAFLPPSLPTAHAQDNAPAADENKGADSSQAAAPKKADNLFMHIVKSLSWFLPIMLIVSIALMSLIVLLVMELRMGAAIPPGFVEEFTDTVNKRRFKEAYEMAKEDGSFLGRVMTVRTWTLLPV